MKKAMCPFCRHEVELPPLFDRILKNRGNCVCKYCGETFHYTSALAHEDPIINGKPTEVRPDKTAIHAKEPHHRGGRLYATDGFIAPMVAKGCFWVGSAIAIVRMILQWAGFVECGAGGFIGVAVPIIECCLTIVILRICYEMIEVVFAIERNTRCGKDQRKALDDFKEVMMVFADRLSKPAETKENT